MSLKDLKDRSMSALDGGGVSREIPASPRRPVTAPGATAMMQPTIDALNERAKKAEGRVAELEALVKDMATTEIPLDSLEPNPWQPRRVFSRESIERLAESISETRLLQPIVVRRNLQATADSVQPLDTVSVPGGSVQRLDTGKPYQIILGERRFRAHLLLGLKSIQAVVVEASDSDMILWALSENIDREDLTDFEVAAAIKRAEAEFPNRKHMARALGLQRSDFYRFLDFFKLPAFVLADLEASPGLLSRRAASDLQATLAAGGPESLLALRGLWEKLKSGEVNQARLLATIAAPGEKDRRVRAQRDIRKLFIGTQQAGSITRDTKSLTICIKAAAIDQEKERRLREFVEALFKA